MLDEDSVPSYAVLGGVGVFLSLVSAGVVVSSAIPAGYIVLSAPIAVGAFILAVRLYLVREPSSGPMEQEL